MGGARFTNNVKLVEAFMKDTPDAIAWLEILGVNWNNGTVRTFVDVLVQVHISRPLGRP
jgi:succinate dehydrogenase/fumarate reductase flavoprotein subunit